MFSSRSLLYDVNVINKILSMILFIAAISIIKRPVIVFILMLIMFFLVREYKYLSKVAQVGLLFSILLLFIRELLFINKLILVIIYCALIIKIIGLSSAKYLVEITTYKYQSKFITKTLISLIYCCRLLKNNIFEINRIRSSYGFGVKSKYYLNLIKMALIRTKKELKEIMLLHELRFYNLYTKRSYLEKPSWEIWDSIYFSSHLLFVFVMIFVGR